MMVMMYNTMRIKFRRIVTTVSVGRHWRISGHWRIFNQMGGWGGGGRAGFRHVETPRQPLVVELWRHTLS